MFSTELVYGPETREQSIARVISDAGRVALGEQVTLHTTDIEAREYQVETWQALEDTREQGTPRALVTLATGLGKTTVGVIDTLRFMHSQQEQGQEINVPKILFVCHDNDILNQASERFFQFAPALTRGSYNGKEKNLDSELTFGTFQSLRNNLDTIDPYQFDYIIYDEAHHAQADTFRDVVEHFTPKFKLALTATPKRMDGQKIEDLFGEAVYSKPLAEAMVEGYLAKVDYHIVFDDAVKKAMEDGFNPKSLKEIKELLDNESRNEEITLQIMEEMERIGLEDAKTIVFCNDINQANEMAELLGGKAYHSGLSDQEQEETLHAFRNNGLQIITAMNMLNEGIDIPDARLIVFLRSTGSKTIFEQQLGRGLRRHEGKDTVSVLDFAANIERILAIKELEEEIVKEKEEPDEPIEGGDPELISHDDPIDGGDYLPETKDDSEESIPICFPEEDPIDKSEDELKEGIKISTSGGEFDFDKISIELIEKFGELKKHVDWSGIETMDDVAALWREKFGDAIPSQKLVKELSRDGRFPSAHIIHVLGGFNALNRALGNGDIDWSDIQSIEDIAALWREKFGDAIPVTETIQKLSKNREFMSLGIISKFGGLNALKSALGREVVDYSSFGSIEDIAALWLEKAGDTVPTTKSVHALFEKGEFMGVHTLAKFGGINALKSALGYEVTDWSDIETIEDLAALWREKAGDEIPTTPLIQKLSKDGIFPSTSVVYKLGGINAFNRALGNGVRDWSDIETIEDLAALWRERCGDSVPNTKIIQELSKKREFMGMNVLDKFGGINALKSALGYEVTDWSDIQTIDDVAALWREKAGDEIPTTKLIKELSANGNFISTTTLRRFGGIGALSMALGHEATDYSYLESIDDVAALWREKAGDEIPTTKLIKELSANGNFISTTTLRRFGGINALKSALGQDVADYSLLQTIDDVVDMWKEKFGDEEPTAKLIRELSKNRKFMSTETLQKFGGINALKSALGYEVTDWSDIQTIDDVAALWREKAGDEVPTVKLIEQLSKNGKFVAMATVGKFGGINALKNALGL